MQSNVIACPHWRQKLPKTATNCLQKRQQMLPKTATKVAVSGNICCRFWRQFVSVRATFVAVFGDYSFCYNLSPFSATFVASVDRLLGFFGEGCFTQTRWAAMWDPLLIENIDYSIATLRHGRTPHSLASSPAMGHCDTCPLDFQPFIFFWSL